MKERRKAYRKGLETGIMTNFLWSSRSSNRRISFTFDEFGDEDWSTEEEAEEDNNGITKSAVVRRKRLQVMHDMPECND